MVKSMFGLSEASKTLKLPFAEVALPFIAITALLLSQWFMRKRSIESVVQKLPWPLISIFLALMLLAIIWSPVNDRTFIYFQF